ncbi:fungal-specific transcription factor domain-containing protein [Xylariaceae sp. FL1651]|nr:fungal-specific transcription factor domain-containing protein [Xylariaceae sp. FL1651]
MLPPTHPEIKPTSMEDHHPPQRKACDLCYRRKIKCDGQQPRCSNCVVYKSDCTNKAASRKAPLRKQAALQRQRRETDLQSRVESLEIQLSTVLEKVKRLESNHFTPSSTASACSDDTAGVAKPASRLPDLPPLQEALPAVERYLANFNSVLPLFHPATLLQTVKSWYENPHSRNPVTWAIINVVLALAHHTSSMGDRTLIGNTATYLNNAQSVLTEIIMRETDLVNVQVLLGLVMLFWTAENLEPALILIASALRLAHRLGLHTRQSSKHLSPTLALQRSRVFWMAYILDRDISLQSRLAPIQLDSDIDLDMPPDEAEEDLAGFVFAADGHTKMNYFRARVELARIQGKVYDCVYSASTQNLSPEKRAQNATRITHMLDDWSSRIPPDFQPAALSRSRFSGLSKYFCILYSTRLSCRALISFASASDSFHYSEWMERLQDFGGKVAAGQIVPHAPVPQGWQELADASREYLMLFESVARTDAFFTRMTLCAYNSSLISLIANRLFDAHQNAIESDKEITKTAMGNLEDMAKETGSEYLQKLRDALQRLSSYADSISSQNITLEQISPTLNFWSGEPQDCCVDPLEYQYCEHDLLTQGFDLCWDPLSNERI